MANEHWEVVVVGAGPGGAAAAKRCAEGGFETLLLEKRALPRDKVCSGMIMGPWAPEIIRDHFGTIPLEVLTTPPVLKGHRFHLPGARPEVLEWPTPLAWRKDLDKEYFHWFFPRSRPRPRFNVNHKGDLFLIEGSGIRELREEINRTLVAYNFDPSSRPVWKDGCLIPRLHEPLRTGVFSPARGNILLIGDAAGLLLPITLEGIGTALKSGLLAAEAIGRSAETGRPAGAIYLRALKPVLGIIASLGALQERLAETAPTDAGALARAIKEAYERTLTQSKNI